MPSTNNNIIAEIKSDALGIFPQNAEDYSIILKYFSAKYTAVDYYWQIGEITQPQGWIINISVVISQIVEVFRIVIPILIEENIPFRIPADSETANNLLNGNLGIKQLGKVLSIYPHSDTKAVYLAQKLVKLTNAFKGPTIPTDICLGNVIYTRYGSFNTIILSDNSGRKDEYIYDMQGQLIKDNYSIPFKLQDRISWPFGEFAKPVGPKPKKILNHIYKPLFFLKKDIRGNVYKGIYVKGFFRTAPCVIKQGAKNMVSEKSGRDIHDRLVWQNELHRELSVNIPLPKIFDLFKEDGDSYLIMEFINGISLYDRIREINFSSRCWFELKVEERTELLGYLLQIVSIVELLHEKGYVHRDLVPGNFLINKKGEIILIDLELAYSINKNHPDPPFEHGTPGFMSPEQQISQMPTIKEDIYGLGALMTIIFTGLSPIRFNTLVQKDLYQNLFFFIGNKNIASLITECLNHNPFFRPNTATISSHLETYKTHAYSVTTSFEKTNPQQWRNTVIAALDGLVAPPIVMADDCWFSRIATVASLGIHTEKEFTRYCGLHTGVGGVLYLLSRAKRMGFNIDTSQKAYSKSWSFIEKEYFPFLPNINPGLYNGAAGLALSIKEGIHAGLLEDNLNNRARIKQCLDLPNIGFDLANGVTGQGIAIIQCIDYLDKNFFLESLAKIIDILINAQEKDGSWVLFDDQDGNTGKKNIRFGYGVPGIIWFLLESNAICSDPRLKVATSKALDWILKKTKYLRDLFNPPVFKKNIIEGPEIGDERKGILLTFIKAYEVFQQPYYKTIVEGALIKYPTYIVKTNFTQETGLAGLGELYLEAFRVFNTSEWKQRADWIANVYTHTFFKNQDGSGHWLMEENNNTTADFMIGNTGIIHFLLRCIYPRNLGYRLLK